jgi:catechol 2,3-dioxygenase-like lactoylglutathione lyase family enzyme
MSVKVSELAYARVQVPDLESAGRFFADFGLIEAAATEDRIYLRGVGPMRQVLILQRGPRKLLSTAFQVGSREALNRLAQTSCTTSVTPRNEPGGGWQVLLQDPDGNSIEVIAEMQGVPEIAVERVPMNSGMEPRRRTGMLVRPPIRPSHVLRLGHVVITTPRPDELARWYRNTLGLLLSDEIYDEEEGQVLLSFSRIDRGEEYVDHHAFQTMAGPTGGVHHISFEVLDIDDLYIGHDCLANAGYRHVWGIGRHKQGSQIFDYWLDPSGIMYEHWTDSDMLNAAATPGRDTVPNALGPWGPPLPPLFITQVA